MSYFKKLSGSELIRRKTMIKKKDPHTRHLVVKHYVAILEGNGSFDSVGELAKIYSIHRNIPQKRKKRFDEYREKLHPDAPPNYSQNIFLERAKVREHRAIPPDDTYQAFVKRLPRGGYQTYSATCAQQGKEILLKEGSFYYYKQATKQAACTRPPHKKASTYKGISAKERYELLYEEYDLVIHLDGKSLEDQEWVWRNTLLKLTYKRMSLAVESKSGTILGVWLEKSHNKSNALCIIEEICDWIKASLGDMKILFITDAGSEYLNNKQLRGIEVTDLDTSTLVKYLREKGHALRITRMPQDNSFVENKNDYIERACLDDQTVMTMEKRQFIEHIDRFIQMNNIYLAGSKKSFRGKGITPLKNIQQRFGIEQGSQWISGLHCIPVEALYKIPRKYEKQSLCNLIPKIIHYRPKNLIIIQKSQKQSLYWSMHPKSLDSSKYSK